MTALAKAMLALVVIVLTNLFLKWAFEMDTTFASLTFTIALFALIKAYEAGEAKAE